MKTFNSIYLKRMFLSLTALLCISTIIAQDNAVNYDELCKPTVTKDGNNLNKRWQVKGEILNATGLSATSPLSFTPSGDNQEQGWANSDNEITAYPGATFDLKLTFGTISANNDCGWGSLFVFQLRSDKTEAFSNEDKIFGKYNGDWENNSSTSAGLFTNIANSGDEGVSASKEELSATFPIKIPADINPGEIVVIRFIVCKTSEGKTYDENPCTTVASQLNYCDYIVRITEEQNEDLSVSWEKPNNGNLVVKNGTNVLTSPTTVAPNTMLTIVPEPDKNYETASVTANGESVNYNPLTGYKVSITKNTTIAATFDILKYQIKINEPQNGSISLSYENGDSFTSGSKVSVNTVLKVSYTANDNYELSRLYYKYFANQEEFEITQIENEYKFTVIEGGNPLANKVITIYAEFTEKTVEPKVCTVGIETNDIEKGSVSIQDESTNTVSTKVGSVLTLKATPKTGYMFDKWTKKGTEEVVSYRNTFDLTVTEDTELVANFIEEGYPLMTRYFITNLSQQNRYFGEVGYNVGEEEIKQLFKCETEEDLPFTAYPELHKQQREGAVIDKTENKIEIVEGTTEFNMLFKQYTKNITYNDVVCEPELEWTQQAIYIDWNNDMKFEGTEIYDRVSGSKLAEENGMTRKIEVPSGIKTGTYRMRVVQMQFDDNNNISHTNLFTENFGEIRLGMAYDFEIVVTPVPNTYSITTATGIKGGKVTLKVDGEEITGKIEEGKTVTVEVTPDKYYELNTLTYKVGEDGEEQDIKETMSFKVTGETVVNATFSKLSYTVTFQQPQNGTIKVMNDKTEIQSGDKVEGGTKLTVIDTPEKNYILSELTADDKDILNSKSFTVENDTEIKAVFELVEYTFNYTINGGEWVADITIKDGEGNVINDGDKVKYGSTYIVRAEKRSKYDAVNIKVNGEQVIAKVNGLVYTYTEKIKGDTHVTIDLYSDIESVDAENVYYDVTAQILYTGDAKSVKVYDLSGRLVLTAENQETVSLAQLADGIYTAVVDNVVLKLKK